MLNEQTKILCCCSGGKVRSIGAKFVLEDVYGFKNILTAGLDKTHPETLNMLFDWAEVILIVGETDLMNKISNPKAIHLDVGVDRFGCYNNADLYKLLRQMIRKLIIEYSIK